MWEEIEEGLGDSVEVEGWTWGQCRVEGWRRGRETRLGVPVNR